MGHNNAVKVYGVWGRQLKDRPLRLFVYMALRSRDGDSAPWCAIGHDHLALLALGLEFPDPDKYASDADYDAAYDAVMRKVRRHLTTLRRAGAISTADRATFGQHGPKHARYRLWLDEPNPDLHAELAGHFDELRAARRRRRRARPA